MIGYVNDSCIRRTHHLSLLIAFQRAVELHLVLLF